ncbi:MAG: hypothetical protein U1F87_10070 [Kiritimatiellia bacterium]
MPPLERGRVSERSRIEDTAAGLGLPVIIEGEPYAASIAPAGVQGHSTTA